MEEQEKQEEFSFIREKIKSKPIDKGRLALKTLWVVFSAILFGLIACLTFVAAKPKFEILMEEPPEGNPVTIPRDQEPEPEDETGESGTEEQPKEQESIPIPIPAPQVFMERDLEAVDFQTLQSKLYAIGKKGNRSIVTVTGLVSGTDWFDSAYERENQASGIIIANNGEELLILTGDRQVMDAEAIHITFINDDVVPATLKQCDRNTGISVISVNLLDISEETMDKVDVAVLGNSLTVNQGTVVLAVGSPLGANYTILAGTITSSGNTVSVWDSTYTIFTTDILGNPQGNGALINLDGEVVGMVLPEYNSVADQNTITAISISQLKGVIEDLSNGKDIPYLGLKVSTVTDEIEKTYGLPKGVYIKEVETDKMSPAMDAGLQEADVITAIDGEEILTVGQYTQKLFSLEPGQEIQIGLLRQNGEDYVEMECTAAVGVLQ